MTTLIEIDRGLPNGFHDSQVRTCALDFVARTAAFELDVWIGDLDSELAAARERYRSAILVISGHAFCQIEPPDPTYPFGESSPLQIDLSEADTSIPLVRALPEGVFAARFYVSNWNAFIQIAGRAAVLSWTIDS